MDWLRTSLLDLLEALNEPQTPFLVGGGYGLHLKRLHVERLNLRTVLASSLGAAPTVRSTNDLDLFLKLEVVSDLARSQRIADAVRKLAFEPIPNAKFLQWKRTVGSIGGLPLEVKIDLLTGPLGSDRRTLHVKPPRVRPKGDVELHAYLTEEALCLEESPIEIAVEGNLSSGRPYRGAAAVPQSFPYLLMKLHAFRDRKTDADRGLGRHHALDLYTIAALMTEGEYENALAWGTQFASDPHVDSARRIVREDFATRTSLGMLRLQEHQLFRDDFPLDDFLAVLHEILPPG